MLLYKLLAKMSDISVKDFMNDAADLAGRAVVQDKLGNSEVAVYFYRESINLLTRTRAELCRRLNENINDNGVYKNAIINIDKKIQEYQHRINNLEAREFSIVKLIIF